MYAWFNVVEGFLWIGVAGALPLLVPAGTVRQRVWLTIASFGFLLFGVSDFLESRVATTLPAWLWALKIGCGGLLVTCRFGYLGWDRFSWRDRYVRFGLACLVAVLTVIVLQWQLSLPVNRPAPDEGSGQRPTASKSRTTDVHPVSWRIATTFVASSVHVT